MDAQKCIECGAEFYHRFNRVCLDCSTADSNDEFDLEQIQQENAIWPWLDDDSMADHNCEY